MAATGVLASHSLDDDIARPVCSTYLRDDGKGLERAQSIAIGVLAGVLFGLVLPLTVRLLVGIFDLEYVGSARVGFAAGGLLLFGVFVWFDPRQLEADSSVWTSALLLIGFLSVVAAGLVGWFSGERRRQTPLFRAVGSLVGATLMALSVVGLLALA